ncbi:MAG: MATE family efflux transporter [Bacteroidota bacterium]
MKDFTEGKIGKQIMAFAMPMLIGQLFQQLYSFVDQIIVGRFLGKEALAAVGASFPIIFTLIALIVGIASGGTVVISQFFGAKNFEKVKRAIDTLFIILAGAAVLLTAIGITFSEQIFTLIQLPPEILPQANTYLTIYISGLFVFFGYNAIASVLRGMGDSMTPLWFLIIATVLNIGLDLLFILVFKMGVAGAAIATVISQGVAFVVAVIYLNKHHPVIKFNIRDFSFDREIFRQSIRIGLPTGLQQTFVAVGMLALMGIVNTFGTDVVAAYTAAGRIDSLAVIPSMIFSQALSTFVGQNIGANRIERVSSGMWKTMIMSYAIALVMTLVIIVLKKPLMGMFTEDADVIRIGGEYLTIVSSFYLFFTTMFILNGVMRGAGDTLVPMFFSLFSLWIIRIPVAYFLSRHIGEAGIWWSIPVGWGAGMVLQILYYRMGLWKRKSVVRPEILAEDLPD